MASLTPYQRDILVKTILGEARGEGVDGMAFVANVIQNRTNSGKFPSDPAAVALQNKQFSTWNKGEGGNNPQQFTPGTKAYEEAARIVDGVFSGQIPDNSGRSLQYHASSVTPYWADEANTNGTIRVGNHIGYPTHPVPPGEIPSVASLLDVRRQAPTPAMPTPATAAIRQMTSPTGGNSDLQSALNTYATRERNRVTPASAEERVTARNRQFFSQPAAPSLSSIYSQGGPTRPPTDQIGIANTGRPMLSNPDGSYSTELSMTITDPRINGGQPTNVPTIWGGRRLSDDQAINSALASKQSFQAFPSIAAAEAAAQYRSDNEIQPSSNRMPMMGASNAARRAVLSMGGNQTYAGRDRSPLAAQPSASDRVRGNEAQTRNVATTIATIPTRQTTASDRVRGNELQTRNIATTIASIPTRAPVSASDMARGKQPAGPTTRVVPTTRVGNSANNIAAQRNEQLATRAPALPRNPVTVPGPSAAPKTAERLAPTIGLAMNPTATRAPVQSGGLSRDALARQAAYTATMINPPARTPPVVTPPRVQQPLPVLRAPAPVPRVAPVLQPQPQPQPQRIAPVPFNRPPLLAASAPSPVARAPLMAGAGVKQAPVPATMSPQMSAGRNQASQNLFTALQQAFTNRQTKPERVWMTGFTGAGTSGGAFGGSADNSDTGYSSAGSYWRLERVMITKKADRSEN